MTRPLSERSPPNAGSLDPQLIHCHETDQRLSQCNPLGWFSVQTKTMCGCPLLAHGFSAYSTWVLFRVGQGWVGTNTQRHMPGLFHCRYGGDITEVSELAQWVNRTLYAPHCTDWALSQQPSSYCTDTEPTAIVILHWHWANSHRHTALALSQQPSSYCADTELTDIVILHWHWANSHRHTALTLSQQPSSYCADTELTDIVILHWHWVNSHRHTAIVILHWHWANIVIQTSSYCTDTEPTAIVIQPSSYCTDTEPTSSYRHRHTALTLSQQTSSSRTVSKATLEKRLRDGVERIWAFPSA